MNDTMAQGAEVVANIRDFKYWLDLAGSPYFMVAAAVIAAIALWKNIKPLFIIDVVIAGTLLVVHFTAPNGTMEEISNNFLSFLGGMVVVMALFFYFTFIRAEN